MLLIGIVVFGSSCECVVNQFNFAIPYNVSPTLDSVRVGDTVWVSATASETMIDLKTQQAKTVVGANISLMMTVLNLTGPNVLTGGVTDFDYAIIDGGRNNVDNFVKDGFLSVNFLEKNNIYEIRVGLVCKTRGQFSLEAMDIPNVRPSGYSQCEAATFNFPIANADNHLYILQNTTYQGTQIQDIVAKTSYSFKVY